MFPKRKRSLPETASQKLGCDGSDLSCDLKRKTRKRRMYRLRFMSLARFSVLQCIIVGGSSVVSDKVQQVFFVIQPV